MSLTATAIRLLAERGLSGLEIAAIAEANEPVRSSGAARQKAYRDRQRNERDVTGDVTVSLETKVSPTPPSKTQTLPTPSPPKGGSVPKLFDQFWSEYPKRVGKGDAKRKFALALKRDGFEAIMAGLGRVKPTWTDPQFIPNPATWLHQDRWLDEAPVVAGPDPPKTYQFDPEAHARRVAMIEASLSENPCPASQ